jgi:hypothetical protein
MPDRIPDPSPDAKLHERALAKWDNEGGASRRGPQEDSPDEKAGPGRDPRLTRADPFGRGR